MKEIAAAWFKAHCLAILDNLGPEGIVITMRGKPVAKLIPLRSAPKDLIGVLRGRIKVKGDLQSTGIRWIAATSLVHDVPLVTRDRTIRGSKVVPLA